MLSECGSTVKAFVVSFFLVEQLVARQFLRTTERFAANVAYKVAL